MVEELFLTEQVVKILEASKNSRPSWDDYFMATAMLIASRSNCGRLHVGCILVSQGEHRNRIISAGYNGFIAGAPHHSRIRDGHEQSTVHAEQNAITDAARRGIGIYGAIAYVSHFPCLQCAKLFASSGISEIKYHFDYGNDPLAVELLGEWGVKVTKL
jgi:dCMP deaminase